MRLHRLYGLGVDASLPSFEGFKYRGRALGVELRLCDFCLRGHRRCYESARWSNVNRCWKGHRAQQWRTSE